LSNNISTPEALEARISKTSKEMFDALGVMNSVEVEARYEIAIDEYVMRIQIESRTLGDIARNHVTPTAIKYQNTLIENVTGLKTIFGTSFKSLAKEQLEIIEEISKRIAAINSGVTKMTNERKKANAIESSVKRAEAYCKNVWPWLDEIRYHCDKLELLVDDEIWPLTKYRELLFTR